MFLQIIDCPLSDTIKANFKIKYA